MHLAIAGATVNYVEYSKARLYDKRVEIKQRFDCYQWDYT